MGKQFLFHDFGPFTLALEWKPADLWIGAFVKRTDEWEDHRNWAYNGWTTDVWICLLPMLPVHLTWSHIQILDFAETLVERGRRWEQFVADAAK